MRVYAPVATPAAPTPAMARPTMRVTESGATPQMRLPTSNIRMDRRKVIFSGKYLKALPPVCPCVLVFSLFFRRSDWMGGCRGLDRL